MNKPDYSRANNVKYYIDGISARRWCLENNASYASFYQRLQMGEDIESIKEYLLERYSVRVSENSTEEIAAYVRYLYIAKLRTNEPIRKLKDWFYDRDMTLHEKDKIWNMVINGQVKPSSDIERWKPVRFSNDMFVSSHGNFKRKLKGTLQYRYYKPYPKTRYRGKKRTDKIVYCIKIDGKEHTASKLIASHFIPNPNNLPYTFLIDGDPSNLRVSNLRWMSKREWGKLTGFMSKSKPVYVRRKHARHYKTFRSVRAAAKYLNVSYQTVLDYLDPVKRPIDSVLSKYSIKYA